MFLISNLFGEYNAETAEGRGANAAINVLKYIKEGGEIAKSNAQKFMEGKLDAEDALKNSALEKLASSYIPYAEINEETGQIDLEYALAFTSIYINELDRDNDGAITVQEAGPCGQIIDQIDPDGKITKAKFLAWLIFQDCVASYNGVISPQEAGKAMLWASSDPQFVISKLREIYNKLNLKEKSEKFTEPQPVAN